MNSTLLLAHTVSPDRSSDLLPSLENRLPVDAVENAVTPEETIEKVTNTEMLVVGRLEAEWLERARQLQLVQTLWAGVDMYPLETIEAVDVAMANASGIHARPIAEQVLGYMLQFERGLLEAVENHRRGVWEHVSGGELGTKTVGIIGVGAIGSRVSELASAFGMKTVGTKRDTSTVSESVDQIYPAAEYYEVLRQADYLVVSCPLTEDTEGMFGMDEFRLLDREAVVINVARGEIIDQDALVRALQYGLIGGAALDVFEEEPLSQESTLWDLSNVIVTPHMAWRSSETTRRWADLLEKNYRAIASGDTESIVNRVL
jgi:phosphoglycerate dehydrogenase-like enzyme